MSNKTVKVGFQVVEQQFAVGTVSGGILVSLIAAGALGTLQTQTIQAAPYECVFADVAPGNYTITAQAVDANGAALGVPDSANLVVPDEVPVDQPVTLQVPALGSMNISIT